MSFACAEVVLGVPLIADAMAGEREGRRLGGGLLDQDRIAMTNNHPTIVPMQTATNASAICIDSLRMVRHRHGISSSLPFVGHARHGA